MFNPPHPGTVLRDYLGSVSVTTAAKHLGITRVALSRILNGKGGFTGRLNKAKAATPDAAPRIVETTALGSFCFIHLCFACFREARELSLFVAVVGNAGLDVVKVEWLGFRR